MKRGFVGIDREVLPGVRRKILESGLTITGDLIDLPEWCKRIKIDCGLSYSAPLSAKWLEDDQDLIVFGFEPVRSSIRILKKGRRLKTSSNYVRKIDIGKRFFLIEAALGETNRKDTIYVTKEDVGCSSLLEPTSFEVANVEEISVITLDSFLSYFPFKKIPYIEHLKTDCQGTDFEVLLGGRVSLSKIAAVTCEVETAHYKNSKNSYENVSRLLSDENFVPINNSPNYVLSMSKHLPESYFKISLRKLYKRFFRRKFIKLDIKIQDPTFANRSYQHLILNGKIKIFQEG